MSDKTVSLTFSLKRSWCVKQATDGRISLAVVNVNERDVALLNFFVA